MAIHVALHHLTHYRYDRPVAHGPHVIRLRPAPHCRTRILSQSLRITGGDHFIHWQQDPFSNWNARLTFPEPMTELRIDVDLVAEMSVLNPFDFFLEPDATEFPFAYEATLAHDLEPFLRATPPAPLLLDFLNETCRELLGTRGWPHPGGPGPRVQTIDFVVALNRQVQRAVRYLIRLEPGVQSPEDTLRIGSGSCRDSAWLLVHVLRHLGLAARFVSGYLIQLTPDVKPIEGEGSLTHDFTDLHAWCEVYLPGAGWIVLDPTSGLLAGEGHIPLSCTPEPGSAAPVTGGVDPCESSLIHEMTVARVHESPRVTRPYSEEQWARILEVGRQVDAELARNDVRLTLGGEPTFVSIDDPEGAEWNTAAVSPRKRLLSGELLRRLQRRFAPGALFHHGLGKWYPGEPLPRWALSAFWRKDGVPIWGDPSLIADEARDYGHGAREAQEFASGIARRLGVDPGRLIPGYEDVFYLTWKERRLPSNVTLEQSRLKDRLERERLARIFQEGIGSVVGYALPLAVETGNRWRSGPWFLRDDDTLWLIPGDSPMGLRLPLDSIPWVSDRDHPHVIAPDPTLVPGPLPRWRRHGPGLRGPGSFPESGAGLVRPQAADERRPSPGESAEWIVRTALCVQPREGRLHVFMPPLPSTESYLDLVSAIEATAGELAMPVIIEGETPPRDPRIERIAVTPDPGVIEVNIHPSRNWDELVDRTTTLYEEARQTRLCAEKFMLDGRHTGTGGGNHIVLGGETPLDSPFLRRPDLLRSLLAYWQNHPSLSWVFSGLFIGPTSQAPRIDEARHDALHELEIAFRQVPPAGEAPPWLVDRLFRNLLIDSSGNTHRAEFSIDKLYSPDSASGRLGLVELRGFEMPPDARMSLAQQLLIRGLIGTFWNRPYTQGLVRWGSDLHDRWMLPHFCRTDFNEVLRDLREAGHPFEPEWFDPHFEFRFPRIGDFAQRDIHVELRTALEPWHVLGEEPATGGTVRYVDSSLERLQVLVRGTVGDRFVLTCNGHRVPLHPTSGHSEQVGGVRYRAWQPAQCLQPNIGVHAPLVFDLVDTWNRRSLGGCTYHVAHPGGRNHEWFPVNAYEAESRRLARFMPHGHTPGIVQVPPPSVITEFPFTLDLRRV
ncbi:MAG: DUF2126 domain-containing protein [Verrucomicrobiota bacterium]